MRYSQIQSKGLRSASILPWKFRHFEMTAAALQAKGKELFSQKKFQEALACYAAALAEIDQKSSAGQEQAAALRANRSLCCLHLGDSNLALSEAEQAIALQPMCLNR